MKRARAIEILPMLRRRLEARGIARAGLFSSVSRDAAGANGDIDVVVTPTEIKGIKMRSIKLRSTLAALVAIMAACISSARADSGTIRIEVFKGGWFVGAAGGAGILVFHGHMYPISIGGLSAGLVFGASQTSLSGRVTNIVKPSDVAGVYGAGGAGVAFGGGVGGIILTNEKGAVLQLSGRQTGLMLNADLSGLAISMR